MTVNEDDGMECFGLHPVFRIYGALTAGVMRATFLKPGPLPFWKLLGSSLVLLISLHCLF